MLHNKRCRLVSALLLKFAGASTARSQATSTGAFCRMQEYTVTYAREVLKTVCRDLSVPDEAFLDHFDQLLASTTGFLRPSTTRTPDPAQIFTRRGMLNFVHDCLYVHYTPDR